MHEKLKAKMEEQNITAYGLSWKTHIAMQDLYSMLNGKKRLYPGWKKRIAEAMGLPEEDLFDENEV